MANQKKETKAAKAEKSVKAEDGKKGVAYNVTRKRLEDGNGNQVKKAETSPIDPEILPKEATAAAAAQDRMGIMKRAEDFSSLERIEASIQRDIGLSGKLDKAGAMVGIKIGLALQSAKALLRHGEYEGWVSSKFGDAFSERKAQYFAKLASAFLRSTESAALALPAPRDAGNWLVVADDGSQLQGCVEKFVGDLTIGELLDKHGVRPAKTKGGWRPAEWLVSQYQGEHEHLKNKAFDVWPKEDQEAFKKWQENQVDGDDAASRRMAAEGTWHNMRATLSDHGIGRKTWKLIPESQIDETRDILRQVLKDMDKARKEG